jgi:hypothetical protein
MSYSSEINRRSRLKRRIVRIGIDIKEDVKNGIAVSGHSYIEVLLAGMAALGIQPYRGSDDIFMGEKQ